MLDQVRAFIKERKGKIQPIVYERLGRLLSNNPEVTKVYLIGSYANGDWVDENTPEWFRIYRRSIGKNKYPSDIDFVTEPIVESTEYYDIQPSGRGENMIIYDNTD